MPDVQILDEDEPRVSSNKSKKRKQDEMRNKELVNVTYFFIALFLCMMGYIVYFTAVKSKDIVNSPYNVRLDFMADRVVRGKILDAQGNVLAETVVDEDGEETRKYPYGDLYAHVVGYDDMGKSGLESTENFKLLTSNAPFIEHIKTEWNEEKNIGDNVITTLDTNLQQAAYDALGSYKGAVIVMEASTGKVLTMVSKPTFNPNTIALDWDGLLQDENSSLLNRAMQGAYAPGSVFKIVTTLEYVREKSNYASYAYNCTGEITAYGTTIHCAGNRVHGAEDLAGAFANSCNASYSDIGLQLNLNSFEKTAKDLLFNMKLPTLLPYTESKFRLTEDALADEVMMTAIGQGKTQVSPYHIALITASIANGGTLMKPYLVDRVESYKGKSIEKTLPKKYGTLMSLDEATQLKEYMTGVVTSGTGKALNGAEYTVAGKTGTAEYSSDKEKSHSWFTGFTNVENPELVITVVVESADNSGMSALMVAKKVLDAYY